MSEALNETDDHFILDLSMRIWKRYVMSDISFCLVSYLVISSIKLATRAQLTKVVRYGSFSSYCFPIAETVIFRKKCSDFISSSLCVKKESELTCNWNSKGLIYEKR